MVRETTRGEYTKEMFRNRIYPQLTRKLTKKEARSTLVVWQMVKERRGGGNTGLPVIQYYCEDQCGEGARMQKRGTCRKDVKTLERRPYRSEEEHKTDYEDIGEYTLHDRGILGKQSCGKGLDEKENSLGRRAHVKHEGTIQT